MNLSRLAGVLCAVVFGLNIAPTFAASIDFNSWTPESYPSVSGFPIGAWGVSSDGSSVVQSNNGQPTFFYSNFDSQGSSFTGTIRVSGGDDDFIGFALGFQPGDSTNAATDYLLIDWKGTTQSYNFNGAGDGPGGSAPRGLAVSRVTGVPTADEFWQHVDNDLPGSPLGDGLEELQRGATLGNTGWGGGNTYEFTFDFGPNNLEVSVDGNLELDIEGDFNDGRFGFYNFSQAGVNYSGFTKDPGTFPPVPIPAAVWLFGSGLIGLAGFGRRRKTR